MDFKRTDLAVEAKEIWSESPENQTKLSGVEAFDKKIGDVNVTVVKILDEKGAAALCKPVGNYITLEVDTFLHRDKNAFEKTANYTFTKAESLMYTIAKVKVNVYLKNGKCPGNLQKNRKI